MAVIKAHEAPRPGKRVSRYDLGDFVLECRDIVAAARAKADSMIAEARAQAEQIRSESHRLRSEIHRQAHEEGHGKGLEEGRQAGYQEALEKAEADFEAKHVQLAGACESTFREVDRRKREMLLGCHRDLVVLGVAIAERVTKRIGIMDREAAKENLRAVIDLVGSASDVVVEVNPVDAETLEAFAPDLVARRSELKHITILANDEIGPGGCVVRTQGGRIDATLETQLERIADELVPGSKALTGSDEAGGDEPDSSTTREPTRDR